MKVLEQTPDRLKLHHVPWNIWFWGVVLILFGSFGLVYLIGFHPTSASLRCDRPTSTQMVCTLEQYASLRRVQTRKLFDIQETNLITRTGSRGSKNYEIALLTPYGEITFLPRGGASYEKTEALVNRINQYLSDSNQRVLIVQQNEIVLTFGLACLTLVLLGGGVWLTSTPKITCAFYKRIDQVLIEYHNWKGVYRTIKYPLHSVISVEIEERRTKNGKVFRSLLVLSSGQHQPLTREFIHEKPVRTVSFAIEEFLSQKQ